MPVRMGELMVVVRAQDFASRTLRRVGGELAGLSTQQQIAARRQQVLFNRMQAEARVQDALRSQAGLRTVEQYNKALATQASRFSDLTKAEKALEGVRAARGRNIAAAHQEIAMARQELDFFRRARQLGATRKIMSPAARVRGIEQAEQRLARAHDALTSAARSSMNAHTSAERAVANAKARYDQAAKSVTRYADQVSKLPSWLRAGAGSSFQFANATSRVNRELATAYQNLSRAQQAEIAFNQALNQLPVRRMQALGHELSGIGRTAQLFGAITTVAFGAAAAAAAEFDTNASQAATQMRNIGVQTPAQALAEIKTRQDQLTNGLKQGGVELEGILGLMQKYPATAQDMTDAAYDIFSSMQLQKNGVTDVAAGLELLERANQIAVAGQTDLAEATNAMITVLNNFAGPGTSTNQILDTMFDIVRFGRMRLNDFNIMMNKIAPAAAGAGQSLEDVGGAMAFLTQVMPSQRMVATGISRLIEAFGHPDIKAGLKSVGIEAENAAGQLRPLDELLTEIKVKLNPQDAAEFFRLISAAGRGGGRGQIFTAEGRRAFNQIMQHFDDYIVAQKQIEENTGEFGAELTAQMQTIGVQWNVFKNQLRALVITIGTEAVPVFARIGSWIERFLGWFRSLNPETRKTIVQWMVWISVGTLVAGIFASIAGSILSFVAMLRLLTMTGGGAVGMLGALVPMLQALAGLGAIAIIMKVAVTGDMTAWDFLLGAAFGAAAGSIFGPGGAILGAVTVPVILMITQDQRKSPMEQAFDQFQKEKSNFKRRMSNFFGPFEAVLPFKPEFGREEFEEQWNRLLRAQGTKSKALKRQAATVDPIIVDLFKKFGPSKQQKDSVKDFFDNLRKNTKGATKDQNSYLAELEKWYNQQLNNNALLDEQKRRQQQLAQVQAQAAQQAVDNLRNMYIQMEQVNRQAFGELFQGPWLTSETFDLAKEWGIQPRIQDLILDLTQQNQAFAKWRSDLDKLMKRGVPTGFINELRQMGPEQGQPLLDQILSAKPGQVNALIAQWKRREAQIKQATKMDFRDEIERFRKAGGDMGKAIINGFQSAGVGAWFDNWVKTTFPGIINMAVQQAVQEWKQSNPPQTRGGAGQGTPPIPQPPSTRQPTAGNNNSRVVNNYITMSPDARDANAQARARRAAFVVGNATKGAIK